MSTTVSQPASGPDQTAAADYRAGFIAALCAFLIWGVAAAYYKLTDEVPAVMVICYRIIGSVLVVGLVLALQRRLGQVLEIFKNRRLTLLLTLSASLAAINWTIFIWAVEVGRVLDASLGYFINPLVSVALGVFVLSERLSKLQVAAIALSCLAVLYQTLLVGAVPWVSLSLAITFALYGLVRKQTAVGAVAGQMVEVLVLFPLALIGLFYFAYQGLDAFPLQQPWLLAALLGTGIVTALPLILFAFGARRLPLSHVGFMQYIAPSIQFVMAVWVFGEPMDTARLASFTLIWLSLALFSYDGVRSHRRKTNA
ncbi:EamA family transporter RarD [Polycladidibacter hongkongensis]|uniref:EamA family transporter RarD n=1 Tax=Polycladidibacter hongkongensis TaxID=1647556 RepID=UPI0008296858|nr:EamA family transporter RarD [Pseudovibrio hongkongensis]